MTKALIWSDLHLHAHKGSVNRLHDCLRVSEWAFQQAEINDCRHIIFLGDLLHEKAKIDVLNYLRTFEVFMHFMMESKPRYDVRLLIGNHDMYHKEKWDVTSVKPLSAIPGVQIVAEPCSLEIGGRLIDFIPHTHNPLKILDKLKQSRSSDSLSLLFGHLAVHGAELNSFFGRTADVIVEYDTDMVPVTSDVFSDWKLTILGHYHCAQTLGRVEYVGSPLQLSFGETSQEKHIMVLDLDTLDRKYIENTFSPKHYILSPSDIVNYDLNNSFVRVVVDSISSKDWVDLKRQILRTAKVLSLDFTQRDKKPEDDRVVVENAKAMVYNQSEMFRLFADRKSKETGLDRDKIQSVLETIASETK